MEDRLIEFVRNNPFLYRKHHKNYKNIPMRTEKFQQLAKELRIPVQKLKKRWRTLRDNFIKEVKRLSEPGSGGKTPRTPWKWWDKLQFLLDVDSEIMMTTDICKRESCSPESVNFGLSRDTSIDDNPLGRAIAPSPPLLTFTAVRISPPPVSTTAPSPHPHTLPTSTQLTMEEIIANMRESLDTFLEKATSIMLTNPVPQAPKSHAQLFFESIAKEVDEANLSPQRLIEVKIEILKQVHELLYN